MRAPHPAEHAILIARHALRHGVHRPLRLIDVAIALEPMSYAHLVHETVSKRERELLEMAAALAVRLVGARTDTGCVAPRWSHAAVLRSWGRSPRPQRPLASYRRDPSGVVTVLLQRWPDPIVATMRRGAVFDERARLGVQLADCWMRGRRWVARQPEP